MAKTVDLSVSTRSRQYLVLGVFTGWLFLAIAAALLRVGVPSLVVVPTVFGVWLGAVVVSVRYLGGPAEGSTWDAIPEWQYDGRFAGAGGLVRSEQEDALREADEE
ncbi:hypothetical protein [Haloarcula halophila]|uniref:hypothetical protein n=1 Tax=Haloarcula TaxID=2237 RepID=UPI0023E4292C|nr:hypothetical protein [Halomicroarcula sp. DFY41]